jgi:hypothetical protein
MKPIKSETVSSTDGKRLFVVVSGQKLDESGEPEESHAAPGALGLIVLTPNGPHLGIVASNSLYEDFGHWGMAVDRTSVAIRQLGSKGSYGWVMNSSKVHFGTASDFAGIYGVIGDTVSLLTTLVTHYDDSGSGACGDERRRCTELAVNYVFEPSATQSDFYPIILRVSGIKGGRPFKGNYRLVFDKDSLKYVVPKGVPEEIAPD